MRAQEKLMIVGQNKLNITRQDKLTMIHAYKLDLMLHKRLIIVRRNKLTKARKLWQTHMKSETTIWLRWKVGVSNRILRRLQFFLGAWYKRF